MPRQRTSKKRKDAKHQQTIVVNADEVDFLDADFADFDVGEVVNLSDRSIFDDGNQQLGDSPVGKACIDFVEAAAFLFMDIVKQGGVDSIARALTSLLLKELAAADPSINVSMCAETVDSWIRDVITLDATVTFPDLTTTFQLVTVAVRLIRDAQETSHFVNDHIMKVVYLSLCILQACGRILVEMAPDAVAKNLAAGSKDRRETSVVSALFVANEALSNLMVQFCEKTEPRIVLMYFQCREHGIRHSKAHCKDTVCTQLFTFYPFPGFQQVEVERILTNTRSAFISFLVNGIRDPSSSVLFGQLLVANAFTFANASNRKKTPAQTPQHMTWMASPLIGDASLAMGTRTAPNRKNGQKFDTWFSSTDLEGVLLLRLFDLVCNADALNPDSGLFGWNNLVRTPGAVTRDIPGIVNILTTVGRRRSELFNDLKLVPDAHTALRDEIALVIAAVTTHLTRHRDELIDVTVRYLCALASDNPGVWLPVIFAELGKHVKPLLEATLAKTWNTTDETHTIHINAISIVSGILKFTTTLKVVGTPGAPNQLASTGAPCALKAVLRQTNDPVNFFSNAMSTPVVIATMMLLPELKKRVLFDTLLMRQLARQFKLLNVSWVCLRGLVRMAKGEVVLGVCELRNTLQSLQFAQEAFDTPDAAKALRECCAIIQQTLNMVSFDAREPMMSGKVRATWMAPAQRGGEGAFIYDFFDGHVSRDALLRHATTLVAFCVNTIPAITDCRQLKCSWDTAHNMDRIELGLAATVPRLVRLSNGLCAHAFARSNMAVFVKHGAAVLNAMWVESTDSKRKSRNKLHSTTEALTAMMVRPVAFIEAALPFLEDAAADFVQKVQVMDMLCTYLRIARRKNAPGSKSGSGTGGPSVGARSQMLNVRLLGVVLEVLADALGNEISLQAALQRVDPVAEEELLVSFDAAMQRCWYFGMDGSKLGIAGPETELKYWLDNTLVTTPSPSIGGAGGPGLGPGPGPGPWSRLGATAEADELFLTFEDAPTSVPISPGQLAYATKQRPPLNAVFMFEVVQATRVLKSALRLLAELGRCDVFVTPVLVCLTNMRGPRALPSLLFDSKEVRKGISLPLDREVKEVLFSIDPELRTTLFAALVFQRD